jgi:hypothetical protein
MKNTSSSQLISDEERLLSAHYTSSGTSIPVYDDGFGCLYIHRDSRGIRGIVRAQSWNDAYSICEDEFYPEADETIEDFIREYGYTREHKQVIRTDEHHTHPSLGAGEKFAVYPDDYTDDGKLPDGAFLRWEAIETPAPDSWSENDLFCEAFGFRPNGPNTRDKIDHGIYAKDLNGDWLDVLTPELLADLWIELEIEKEEA